MRTLKTAALAAVSMTALALAPSAFAQETKASPGMGSAQTAPQTAAPDAAAMKATQAKALDRADSDMSEVLKALQGLNGKPIQTLSAEEARKQPTAADATMAVIKAAGIKVEPKVKAQDTTYQGAAGELQARIYTPTEADTSDGPLPVVLYFHGGGWVIANIDTYEASAQAIAEKSEAIVVSATYRQGPENKFPAAHDDAVAAYKWVLANAGQFGGDPARVAVVGESAGGNLAANVAIAARDQNLQAPVHMGLIYPVAGNDMNTESYKVNADAMPLNKPMMEWFVKQVTSSPEDTKDPRINLLGADLKGLPDATVITAEIDPLRSEGEALAEALEAADVDVEHEDYEGSAHEFFGMGLVVDDADDAQDLLAENLSDAFDDTDDGRAAAPATSDSGAQAPASGAGETAPPQPAPAPR